MVRDRVRLRVRVRVTKEMVSKRLLLPLLLLTAEREGVLVDHGLQREEACVVVSRE